MDGLESHIMRHLSQIKIAAALAFCILFFAATPVFAANIFLDAKSQFLTQGEEFLVNVFLNTEGESINAVEGKLMFSADLLEAREIRDGNSIINFWIERPKVSKGEILFSGIIPGGYLDKQGLIFSIVFQARQAGRGSVEIREIKALLNDGKGTATNTTISNLELVISGPTPLETPSLTGQAAAAPPPVVENKDTDLPETFEPMVASDSAIFDGKYFLVFATQDKGSGIGHYEVREKFWAGFVTAASPYLLQNQRLDKKIFVKAIDKNGNERIVMLPPQKPLPWYRHYAIFAILLVLIVVGFLLKKLWSRHFTKNREL